MFRPWQAGNQVFEHRGPKPQGGHICKYNMRCMQQPGGKHEMGGTEFKSDGLSPLLSPKVVPWST